MTNFKNDLLVAAADGNDVVLEAFDIGIVADCTAVDDTLRKLYISIYVNTGFLYIRKVVKMCLVVILCS